MLHLLVRKLVGYLFAGPGVKPRLDDVIADGGDSEGRAAPDGVEWVRQAPQAPSGTGLAVTLGITNAAQQLAVTWAPLLVVPAKSLVVFPTTLNVGYSAAGGTVAAAGVAVEPLTTGESVSDGIVSYRIVPPFAGGITLQNQDPASQVAWDWFRGAVNVALHSPPQAGDGAVVASNEGTMATGCSDPRNIQLVSSAAGPVPVAMLGAS